MPRESIIMNEFVRELKTHQRDLAEYVNLHPQDLSAVEILKDITRCIFRIKGISTDRIALASPTPKIPAIEKQRQNS